jgi:hypothetical protein
MLLQKMTVFDNLSVNGRTRIYLNMTHALTTTYSRGWTGVTH